MKEILKYCAQFTTWTFFWMQAICLASLVAVISFTDMANASEYVRVVYLPDPTLPLGTSLFFCLGFIFPPIAGCALAATQTLANSFTG